MSFETGYDINFDLPDHWAWCTVDELKVEGRSAIISGPFGSNISSKFFMTDGIPVIRGNNLSLSFDRFIDDGFVFITQEKAYDLNTWAKRDDIILTAAGTIGQVGIIGENTKYPDYIISNKQIRVRLNTKKVLPLFVYYWLASSTMVQYIQQRNTGSTIPLINLSIVKSLPVPLPPIGEQENIVNILSALDDKIELNRQTNAMLEAIAQAIFKEWFVDFNFPGATGELVESELGMIPKGWRVDSILCVAELLSGGTPRTENNEFWDGDVKWVSAKDVSSAYGSFVLDTERKITQLGVNNSSTKILPKLTTIVTARGTVGNYCILSEPMAMNQTNYGLKAKEQESDYFVFYSLSNLVAQLKQASYGTIFDTVTTITFEKSKIIIPPYFIIREFDQIVRPLMGTILGNLEQSNTLSKIRDSLLPKLMSGEIEV